MTLKEKIANRNKLLKIYNEIEKNLKNGKNIYLVESDHIDKQIFNDLVYTTEDLPEVETETNKFQEFLNKFKKDIQFRKAKVDIVPPKLALGNNYNNDYSDLIIYKISK